MTPGERTEKMCRACLSHGRYSQLISLYSGGCAMYDVPKKMMNIGNVSVHEGDGLPSMICQKCVFLVKVADCFKRQIKTADKELRKIWARTADSEGKLLDAKTAANSSDSEIEDLAYDPEYISEEVKADVEKAFRRKHRMLRDREFEVMSKILHNLDKKQFFPSLFVKNEVVETERSDNSTPNDSNEFDKTDSVENADPSDNTSNEFHENPTIESETSVSVPAEESAEDFSRNNLDAEQFHTTENPKTTVTENPADISDKEATNVAHPETDRIMNEENVDPNIIVISDTSDCEAPKCEENASTATPLTLVEGRMGNASLFLRGTKRKSRDFNRNKRTEVKKTYKTIQEIKARKAQSNKKPRTYFLCTCCNIQLQSVAAVLLHHNEVHSPNKNLLQCRMCEKSFATKQQLLAHFDRHSETHLFRCSYCPNEFVLKDNLTRHMLSHTSARNKRAKTSTENPAEDEKPESPTKGLSNGLEDSGKKNEIAINS